MDISRLADNIVGCFVECALTVEYLERKRVPIDSGHWSKVEIQLQQAFLARARYLEGEYELAQEAMPAF